MARHTRHMSTSELSDAKPEMVLPTRYRLNRGKALRMHMNRYRQSWIFWTNLCCVCWAAANLSHTAEERAAHLLPAGARSSGGAINSTRCDRFRKRSAGVW